MKYIIVSLITLLIHPLIFASELKDFCEEDPTGEIYSELWDSELDSGLQMIGLNPYQYRGLLKSYDEVGLEKMAEDQFLIHPEIKYSLEIWKLKTCIDRGYKMLTEK